MSNPFDRNKTKEAKLGQIITDPGEQNQRDAIHIAVVPVVASTTLARGQLVGVTPDGKRSVIGNGNSVGIVDPFLVFEVKPGETFWLFLFQGTVNTLRHEWTHDAFPAVSAPQSDEATKKAASEAWLRAWCASNDCPRYETVLAAVLDGNRADWDRDYIHFDGQDAHAEIPGEFWDHMERVTGNKYAPDDRATGFSCSC